jgi:hypothetical protein
MTQEDMARLSASEVACYRWPEDTAEDRAMRAAFCDGAAHIAGGDHAPESRKPKWAKPGWWTHDDGAAKLGLGHFYYFAPAGATAPPYKTQRHVSAIVDIAFDGTLAGVELIEDMPAPPPIRVYF